MQSKLNYVTDYAAQFDDYLLDYINPLEGNLDQPIKYLLKIGGKRIRPILVLASTELYNGAKEEALNLALAMELFHNFTLMHDDIMDNASLRRGNPTVHEKWNLSQAILSGDGLLIRSYMLLNQLKTRDRTELLSIFNQMAMNVCLGQQMDMDFENREEVSISEYLEMIKLKTSVLLGSCLELGGFLAGAPDEDLPKLNTIGVELGLAFQIQDDYLDAFGEDKVGKQRGGDIIANKKTFLMTHLLEIASETQTEMLKELKNEHDQNKKVEEVLALMEGLGLKEITERKVKQVYNNARKNVGDLIVNPKNLDPINNLIDHLEKRDF